MSGAFKSGLIFILVGAMLTALPNIIITSISGMSEFLQKAGISNGTVTDALSFVVGSAGSCEDIPVDFSYYDERNAAYDQSPGIGADGKPLPSPRRQGAPSIAGSKSGATSMFAPPSADDAKMGPQKGGCGHLVEGEVNINRGFLANGGRHMGVDIGCRGNINKRIFHQGGGTIILAGDTDGGYGRRVIISMGGGKIKTYNHMSRFMPGVVAGASAPNVLGYCGNTGRSFGAHLHFEIKMNGRFVDPPTNGC